MSSMFCQFFPYGIKNGIKYEYSQSKFYHCYDIRHCCNISRVLKKQIFMWVGGFEMTLSTLELEQYTNFKPSLE